MVGKLPILIGIIILFLPLLSGCWDSLDIEKRVTVLALAIDKAEPGAEDKSGVTHVKGDSSNRGGKELIRLTAQIAVPGRIPLGPQSEGGQQNPVWVLSVVGPTLEAALLNLKQELSDKIFLGHLRVIMISEEIAKEGVNRFNDYLRRQPEIRRTAWMAISEGKAADFMYVAPELERVPALYLTDMVENTVTLGKFPEDPIGIFWRVHVSKGQDSFLPYLEIKEGPDINLGGLAYFKGDSMKGLIEPVEIGLLMAIINEGKGGYGAFYDIPGTDQQVLLRSMERKSKIKTTIQNGVPKVQIKVRYENEIVEEEGNKYIIDTPEVIRKIEKQFNKDVDEAFKKLIKEMQEEGSDIFGIGEYVRAKHPAYWRKNIKTKEDWQNIFKEVEIEINTLSQIKRVGMKAR